MFFCCVGITNLSISGVSVLSILGPILIISDLFWLCCVGVMVCIEHGLWCCWDDCLVVTCRLPKLERHLAPDIIFFSECPTLISCMFFRGFVVLPFWLRFGYDLVSLTEC